MKHINCQVKGCGVCNPLDLKNTQETQDIRMKAVEYGTLDLQQIAKIDKIISQKLKEQRREIVLELEKCKEDENIWDYIYALKKQI